MEYNADKQLIMKGNSSQVINTVCIIVGGGLLIYQISTTEKYPYLMILGLVLLMFGLYRATNHWVETKDDHKEDGNQDADKNS